VVELHDYETLEAILHQAFKVEICIQRRKDLQRYSSWNSHKEKKEEEKTHQGKYSKLPHSSFKDSKYFSPKDHKTSSSHAKNHALSLSSLKPKVKEKTSRLKCFKCLGYGHKASYCPNERVTILKNGEVEYVHSSNSTPSPSTPYPTSSPLSSKKVVSIFFPQGKETCWW